MVFHRHALRPNLIETSERVVAQPDYEKGWQFDMIESRQSVQRKAGNDCALLLQREERVHLMYRDLGKVKTGGSGKERVLRCQRVSNDHL